MIKMAQTIRALVMTTLFIISSSMFSATGVQALAVLPPIKLGQNVGFNFSNPVAKILTTNIGHGYSSAFNAENARGGILGRNITVEQYESAYIFSNFTNITTEYLDRHPDTLCFFGQLGDTTLASMMESLELHDIMMVSPLSTADYLRTQPGAMYNPRVVYPTARGFAEVVAILRLVIEKLRVRRIGFYRTFNIGYAAEKPDQVKQLLAEYGMELCGIMSADFYADSGTGTNTTWNFTEAFAEFAATRPQVVINYGMPGKTNVKFISTFAKKFPDAVQVFPPHIVTNAEKAIDKANLDPAGRMYMVHPTPLGTDTRYAAVRKFQEEFTEYWGNTSYLENDGLAVQYMRGWFHARFMVEVLKTMPAISRTELKKAIFNMKTFRVEDIPVGVFSGACDGVQVRGERNALCECNEGGHMVDVSVYASRTKLVSIPEVAYSFPVTECTPLYHQVLTPLLLLNVVSGSAEGVDIAATIRSGSSAADVTGQVVASTRKGLWLQAFYNDTTAATSGSRRLTAASAADTKLGAVIADHVATLSFLSATGLNPASDVGGLPHIDPLPVETVATLTPPFRREVLILTATLEQQLFAVAQFCAGLGAPLAVVARGAEAATIVTLGEMSMNTFGLRLAAGVALPPPPATGGDPLTLSAVAPFIFASGLATDADVQAVLSFLRANPSVTVFVPFQELAALWNATFPATGDESDAAFISATQRLVAATSLPNFAEGGNSTSALVRDFTTAIGGENSTEMAATPLAFQAFIAARAVRVIVERIPRLLSPESFLSTWYEVGSVSLESGFVFGPFSDSSCAEGRVLCETNVGARGLSFLSVWEMAAKGNDTASANAPTTSMQTAGHRYYFSSGKIAYRSLPPEGTFPPATIVGIVLGIVLFLALVGVVVMKATGGRSNKYAPQDASIPFTLMFTDIQSSTALWANAPVAMGPALDEHHAIIRKLILKHRGYEVKTIGDAFMIAFADAKDAVELAKELQEVFFTHEWDTKEIDYAYREWELENCEDPPSANLPMDEYQKCWNGLRVRIGINTGIGEIKFEEATQGYDYYGTVANCASRTEAAGHGGQIMLTQATYDEAFNDGGQSEQHADRYKVTDMGSHTLRGISDPVQLFAVDTVPGRAFGPIRTDGAVGEEGNDEFDNNNSDLRSGDMNASTHSGTMSHASLQQNQHQYDTTIPFEVLNVVFSTSTASGKRDMLSKLCEKWRVQPRRDLPKSDDPPNYLLLPLAARIAPIVGKHLAQQQPELFGPLAKSHQERGASFIAQNSSGGRWADNKRRSSVVLHDHALPGANNGE